MSTVSELQSGTRTTAPVEGAFVSLGTDPQTVAHAASIVLDLDPMLAGDTVEVRLIEKVLSGGSQKTLWHKTFSGADGGNANEPVMASPMIPVLHGWAFQMKQTAGSSRNFDWSIRVAGS